ncbi:MAG TPA: hypothetical protein VEV17_19775 [Bryobacteraceae bacterium]|nr:hypothetical protein [Bryobacteraceae bacterium]
MKLTPLLILLLALAGCARPPQIATTLDISKESDNLIVLKLKIVNLEDRATVPIAIELTGEAETNGNWDKPATLLHPAAFVLNRKEEREITKLWRVPANAVRTTLIVREQESGRLLKSEKSEKRLVPAPAPTAQP